MKKLILSILVIISFSSKSQTLVFDQMFIKAHDIDLYDDYITDHFSNIMGKRVENGTLHAWDVWKVVENPQEDFTHMITFIYDFDKEESEWNNQELSGLSEVVSEAIMKDVNIIRERVGRAKLNDLGSVRKKGAPAVPNIMVLNFMKVKDHLYKSYETAEIEGTKKISENDLRVGWNFHRRLDDYGSDTYFSHITIDWYDNYRDYLRSNMGDVYDSKDSEWNKLRDLKKRVIMRQLVSMTNN
tara:strand:- start:404 stop:1129 length:726 start_codon:yes stop_codon:yes gene_type:complete